MRVAEERHSVGVEPEDGVDRLLECLRALVREAVHEVEIDALKAVVPRPTDGLLDEVSRLHAVDGLVYNRVDVLHAVADPVESRRGRPRNSVAVRSRGSASRLISAVGDTRKTARVCSIRSAFCSGVR